MTLGEILKEPIINQTFLEDLISPDCSGSDTYRWECQWVREGDHHHKQTGAKVDGAPSATLYHATRHDLCTVTHTDRHRYRVQTLQACAVATLRKVQQISKLSTSMAEHILHVNTRKSGWNPNSNTMEPDRPQHDRPAACVIAQQYSSASSYCAFIATRNNSALVRIIFIVSTVLYFLGAFADLWKATNFVLSVCPSAWNNSVLAEKSFIKSDTWVSSGNLYRTLEFH